MSSEKTRVNPSAANGALGLIYVIGFLAYLQSYLPIYINSSFLNQFLSEENTGLIYALGSILGIAVFLITPKIIEKAGLFRFGMGFGAIYFLALLALGLGGSPFFLVVSFLCVAVFFRFILYSLDILLEEHSTDKKTGGIRGTFLTINNVALIISPLLSGLIIGEALLYQRVYLVAALVLVITLVLIRKPLEEASVDFKAKKHASVKESLKHIKKDKNIYSILMSNMILRIFYAGMVVYTPIYLHEYIGFAWSEIGVMFTIMLLPFVLLEYPLGKMADSRFGEKEILSAGFICMALFTAILSFVSLPSLILWTALLFMTRIGASAVEIMSETYFFKKIDWGDSNLLSFFRIVDPIAYIITPLVVSVLIYFFDFRWVFLALSVIVLFGLRYSLSIKDTL